MVDFIREYKDGKLILTNTETGEIKQVPMATDKQMRFIRELEQQLSIKPKQYRNLTVWQAAKVIKRLNGKQRPLL